MTNVTKKRTKTKTAPNLGEVDEAAAQQRIRERAYFNWINRGCLHGDETNDWLEAEQQVVDSLRTKRT